VGEVGYGTDRQDIHFVIYYYHYYYYYYYYYYYSTLSSLTFLSSIETPFSLF